MGIGDIWQQYISSGGSADATAFGVWLIREQPFIVGNEIQTPDSSRASGATMKRSFDTIDHNTKAAILVGRLERYLHFLTKSGMKASGITEDEFGILATLLYMTKVTKSQLLKQCLIEIPTGSELLKRMRNAGLILEKKNPEDARSALIMISAKGRAVLFNAFFHLDKTENALSVLSLAEKETLVSILNRLDLHHSKRHEIRHIQDLMK